MLDLVTRAHDLKEMRLFVINLVYGTVSFYVQYQNCRKPMHDGKVLAALKKSFRKMNFEQIIAILQYTVWYKDNKRLITCRAEDLFFHTDSDQCEDCFENWNR